MACSTNKKKTTKPAKVRTLDSYRKSEAKLSKGTKSKLNAAYIKRKTAKRKTTKKKAEPKLSDSTNRKLKNAYTRRKLVDRAKKNPKPMIVEKDLREFCSQYKSFKGMATSKPGYRRYFILRFRGRDWSSEVNIDWITNKGWQYRGEITYYNDQPELYASDVKTTINPKPIYELIARMAAPY